MELDKKLHEIYAEVKEQLLEHLLYCLNINIDDLRKDKTLQKELQHDIVWEKVLQQPPKEYLVYRGDRVGDVEVVFENNVMRVDVSMYDVGVFR